MIAATLPIACLFCNIELIHFVTLARVVLRALDVRSFTEVANFVSERKMSDYGAGDHSDF